MNRRQVLRRGLTLGAVCAAGGVGRFLFLPPRRSRELEDPTTLARRLFDSFDHERRETICLAYDHPYRQYHNRGVGGGGADIDAWAFSWEQRRLLTDLFYAGLSARGREIIPNQFFINWPGVELMRVALCGNPHDERWQALLTGPHINLRIGGASAEGAAFGGPQVYGDQRGNNRSGLPGNVHRHQFEAAQAIFEGLESDQKERALLPEAPIQTRIEVRGAKETFSGVEVADLRPELRAAVGALIDDILLPYPEADVSYAKECIAANGGMDALSLAWYADGELDESGRYQIFRIEGPGTVLYFRGAPHVHAFINISMDAENPLSVGEPLAENTREHSDGDVKRLFERAMMHGTGSDLAYYPLGAVVGRLPQGTVRTGDIYVLESWQDRCVTTEVTGAQLGGALLSELEGRGAAVQPERRYRVATIATAAGDGRALGGSASWTREALLRDLTIDYVRERQL